MTITIADGRGALWQWDTGRRVKITDGVGVKQIHYQNRCFGCSVDVDVGDDGTAIIPDELLQDYHRLTAYAYAADDTGAYTMVQQDFAVYKRAKPADYVYTPTEQMTLQTIQRQIGDLANLTTEAKDTLVAAINEAARSGGGAGSMDLRVADGYIQYSNDGSKTWENLIAVADLKGADGAKGDKGDTGAPGQQGPQGESGVKGSDGVTPTIGENGDWYIGDTDTGKPSRGEKGEKGEPGSDGAPGVPGAPGIAATISVGKVTTGAAGTGASVSNSGSSTAAVFDFTIPRGAKGEKGDKGEQGAPGNPGAPGAAGQDGHSPVVTASKTGKTTTISVDGTAVATVVDGADGAPGKNGADGKPGAAGPAGAPGKDGAGMDITGAKAGQIAKITAVDASGVPTAWGPADMPSGSGSADAVLYTAQTLTEAQQFQARKNIGAIGHDSPQFQGYLALAPANETLGSGVGLSPTGSGHNYTLDISDVDEGNPTLLTGVKTPTDADINAAATVEYVNAKVASGGGSPDAVLYTAQTLTDTQKKQARENVDAAIADFVINGTVNPNNDAVTLDKTFAQIQEAVKGLHKDHVQLRLDLTGLTLVLPLSAFSSGAIAFQLIMGTSTEAQSHTVLVSSNGATYKYRLIATLNSDYTMPQVSMDFDPVEPMEIATKQYVDDALDGKAGTAVATTSANGLMSKDDKAKLDGITGQVTADKVNAPDNITDLVQYGAFQIASQQIISRIPTVPTALKNPNALTIKIGGTTVTYDGSTAQTVTIADGTEVEY